MKKLSLLFAFSLLAVLCVLSFSSCTSSPDYLEFGDYRYTVENNEVTVVGYQGSEEHVVIPASIDGMPVAMIGGCAFSGNEYVLSVTIPDTVKKIQYRAFDRCAALEHVSLGNGIRAIEFLVFYRCDNLKYNEYENGYYLGNEENPYIALVSVISKKVEAFTIHPDTVIICSYAFEKCSLLRELRFPDDVLSIESYALVGCYSLERIYLSKSLESFDTDPFYELYGYVRLYEIVVPEENLYFKSVDGSLFSKDGTRLIKYAASKEDSYYRVPDGTVLIDSYAFGGADRLTEVVLPDSVEGMGRGAFWGCENLNRIHLGSSLKMISSHAFYDCALLTEITIPASVEEIEYSAFNGCTGLRAVYFEDPEGWYISRDLFIPFSAPDPSDPEGAAKNLLGRYRGDNWVKNYWEKFFSQEKAE